VNKCNLKFTTLNTHYKPGLALELKSNPGERGKTNQMRIKRMNMVICFTKVWFQRTKSPLRRSQRPGLFQPFPSLKRSLRPRKDHHTLGVSCLAYKALENERKKRKAKPSNKSYKRTQEHPLSNPNEIELNLRLWRGSNLFDVS
jgi:hypothetical protein